MQDNIVLQRFKKFRAVILSSNISNDLLLDMVENYLTSNDDDNLPVESVPVLDGQISLYDYEFCA